MTVIVLHKEEALPLLKLSYMSTLRSGTILLIGTFDTMYETTKLDRRIFTFSNLVNM